MRTLCRVVALDSRIVTDGMGERWELARARVIAVKKPLGPPPIIITRKGRAEQSRTRQRGKDDVRGRWDRGQRWVELIGMRVLVAARNGVGDWMERGTAKACS